MAGAAPTPSPINQQQTILMLGGCLWHLAFIGGHHRERLKILTLFYPAIPPPPRPRSAVFKGWLNGDLYLDLTVFECRAFLVSYWGKGCDDTLRRRLRLEAYCALGESVELEDICIANIRETQQHHTTVRVPLATLGKRARSTAYPLARIWPCWEFLSSLKTLSMMTHLAGRVHHSERGSQEAAHGGL